MKRMAILAFVFLQQIFFVDAQNISQNTSNQSQIKEEIQQLINQHEESMPQKKFVKLWELTIPEGGKANQTILDTSNTIIFSFMGDNTFRFYTYSPGVDARILLKQRTGGFHEKEEEKTLLDLVKKGDDNRITYHDYEYEEDNDFLLTFLPISEVKGYSILIVYQIVDKDWMFKRDID
jgi:hypothetical protein